MAIMETVKTSFGRFNVGLYFTLITRLLFPTAYQTFRVALLGALPDASALSIAAQMQWVNLLLEVIEEGLLQPLYHCLGLSLDRVEATRNKTKTGFAACLVVYSLFAIVVSASASPLVSFMGQDEALHDETVDYVRLELVAVVVAGLAKFLMVVMVMSGWNVEIFVSLAAQMVTSITLDVLLASEKVANMGTTGVALSSIGTGTVVLITNFAICWRKLNYNVRIDFRHYWDFSWFRRWTRVGAFSAIDSLIRNAVYLIVVIRAMNLLDEQASYWTANTFIWNWLLLPALPLAELLKQDVASETDRMPHQRKLTAYAIIAIGVFALWAVTFPAWAPFIEHVLNAQDPDLVERLVLILSPCYAAFILGILANAVYYAFGRTEILAGNSLLSNLVLVALFLLMIYEVIPSTVYAVAGIFGVGLVLGAVISITIYFAYFIRRHSSI